MFCVQNPSGADTSCVTKVWVSVTLSVLGGAALGTIALLALVFSRIASTHALRTASRPVRRSFTRVETPGNQCGAVFRGVERRQILVCAQKAKRSAHRMQRARVARSQSQRLDHQRTPCVRQARQARQARQDQPHSSRKLDYL